MTDQALPGLPQLDAIEARILGALMEKQLTTPDAYPLTLNNLVLACNQKTSREPVSHYQPGEIEHSLRLLEQRKLVDVEWGSRADRYQQRLSRVLGVDKKVQALLNVMLLRGPQTVHELFTRCQRMHDFADDAEIAGLLELLCDKTTPVICRLPRQSGQREERYMHLLSGEPDVSQWTQPAGRPAARPLATALEERLAQLEQAVADQAGQIGQLQEQLAILAGMTGRQD
ncbi:MAG TPA: YceH family protein [Pseudomonadales bacterium]